MKIHSDKQLDRAIAELDILLSLYKNFENLRLLELTDAIYQYETETNILNRNYKKMSIRIVRQNKSSMVQVFDGNDLIHSGDRPVDNAFARNVHSQLLEMGYRAYGSNVMNEISYEKPAEDTNGTSETATATHSGRLS